MLKLPPLRISQHSVQSTWSQLVPTLSHDTTGLWWQENQNPTVRPCLARPIYGSAWPSQWARSLPPITGPLPAKWTCVTVYGISLPVPGDAAKRWAASSGSVFQLLLESLLRQPYACDRYSLLVDVCVFCQCGTCLQFGGRRSGVRA